MRKLSEKLLAISLMLLMGLSPLQSAVADILVSPDQKETTTQAGCMHDDDMRMASAQSMHDCDTCSTDHMCSFGHCASCAVTMAPTYVHAVNLAAAGQFSLWDKHFPNHPATPLFRPPRV